MIQKYLQRRTQAADCRFYYTLNQSFVYESVNLLQCIIYSNQERLMNEFISPHQNININISYNLGNEDKMPKVVFGKKLAKIVKSTIKQEPKSFFKSFKKTDDVVPPTEDSRKFKTSKKNKAKKKSNILITFPDQQQPLPRRLKTESCLKSQNLTSVYKKELKNSSKQINSKLNTQHSKSLNNPPVKKSVTLKKGTQSQGKQKKQQKRNENKSCILYQPKRNLLISEAQHAASTLTAGPTPSNKQGKKRANSANVLKCDKFINKLLDMSVLTSQLGGSIPMHEDKSKNIQISSNSNRLKTALQGFMNSVDLRIIKKMEQDNIPKFNKFVNLSVGDGLDLVTYLNRIRRIPMQKLVQKAVRIQRFWRKKTSQNIIPYYSNMFFRNPVINSKAAIQNNLNEISRIEKNNNLQSEEDINQQSADFQSLKTFKGPDIFGPYSPHISGTSKSQFEEQSISAAKIKKMMEPRSYQFQDSKISDEGLKNRIEQINECEYEDEQLNSFEPNSSSGQQSSRINIVQSSNSSAYNSRSLNIEKYKQLVRQEIQLNKNFRNPRLKNLKEANSENKEEQQKEKNLISEINPQSAHWNHVHNILSTNMNTKLPLLSKQVLDQLMKQSAYNKQWVEGQIGNSNNISLKQSPRGAKLSDKQFETSKNQLQQHFQQKSSHASSEQIPHSEDYNWNKYSDISQLKKPQQIGTKIKASKQEEAAKPPKMETVQEGKNFIFGLLPSGIQKNIIEQSDEVLKTDGHKDEKWIRQQMVMEDGIIQNYLDCGLDSFGLKLQKNQILSQAIQQFNEDEIQEKQEHKATLQRHHQHNQNKKMYENLDKPISEIKEDDIFSNNPGENNDQDIELVYVFNNSENKVRQFSTERQQTTNFSISKNTKQAEKKQLNHQKQKADSSFFQPSFRLPSTENVNYTEQQMRIQEQLNTKRKQKVVQHILTILIEQFAQDTQHEQNGRTSNKNKMGVFSPNNSTQSKSLSQVNQTSVGIKTNFQSIRDFISKLKQYVLGSEEFCKKMIENLKNNIGPSSMQILSYLRVEQQMGIYEEEAGVQNGGDDSQNQQEWLFVIPNQIFQIFNKKLLDEEEQSRGKKLTNKFKLYTQFWHRSIFECFNECLDFERPYGIVGAPYVWICQPKLPRAIPETKEKIQKILDSAENRLLDISYCNSGVIFDKPDSPYFQFDVGQQDKANINQQKISRMLATQILQDEYNWITYNDQITELLVDISRKIQEILIFQVSTDLKKIGRRRKMMVHLGRNIGENSSSDEDDQHAVFVVEDLI